MKNFRIQSYVGVVALSLIALASACNKGFDKVIPDSPSNEDTIQFRAPKVLYIIADGARGPAVRDAAIPNLKSLLPSSIYTWNGIADTSKNDATNWADMLTGVRKEKHQVLGNDFANNNLDQYPVIFERIKEVNPQIRIASYATSAGLKNNLTAGADVSEVVADDNVLKNTLVEVLKSDTAGIIVGEFSGIEKAGKASGVWGLTDAGYKQAIADFDTRVGELIAAVKTRPNYAKENWLIIVTSNRGGAFTLPTSEDDKTLFSNTYAQTFTIFQNSGYRPTFIGKPFLGSFFSGKGIRFKGDPEKSAGLVSAGLSKEFNFGTNTDFTVSIKIKKSSPKNTSSGQYWYQWPSIVGKRTNVGWGGTTANPGWDICLFYNRWRLMEQGGDGNQNGEEIPGLDFSGNTWHDLTFVVEKKADGRRYVRLYTDGVKGITGTGDKDHNNISKEDRVLAGTPNFDNNAQMRVGFAPGEVDADKGYINVQLRELKIWKKALSESVIQAYACDASMDESHPDWETVLGYWPMDEGDGGTLKDLGPFGADFTMQGTYAWETFEDLICSPSNSNLSTLVPKNSDIPTQILGWFNIARQDSWGLDGRVWISN
ncbi:MAG TPA: DUF4983 domain-containing protein [Pedobacter sp.]|nr:DUF4983 domain-containing protein [Pedobacter sp.]